MRRALISTLLLCSNVFLVTINALSAPMKRREPVGRLTTLDRTKLDLQSDNSFYSQPNLVVHADKSFLYQLTALYEELIPENSVVLDMMSSHVSHLPPKKLFTVT
jgi:hypothetical protein